MRKILIIGLGVALLTGCISRPKSTSPIVGKWEATEMSHDLGKVHAVWRFTSDGKTRWTASILNGKEEMKDSGTYTLVGTNLIVQLDRFGPKNYSVVFLDDALLRLSITTSTNTLELRKMR